MPSLVSKPEKPTADFPLFAHASGSWAKKIGGKLRYFGSWNDPEGAREKYEREFGIVRTTEERAEPTLGEIANRFLTVCTRRVAENELSVVTLGGYHGSIERFLATIVKERKPSSLTPDDFRAAVSALRKTRGLTGVASDIRNIRSLFKFAFAERLIRDLPHYGTAMKQPSKRMKRLHRHEQRRENGKKLFSRAELRSLIDTAKGPMRAMILLGVNCGLGNSDISRLEKSAIDLERGWLDYPRPKTGIDRRCPLWPETIDALREAIAARPVPRSAADRDAVFLTRRSRRRWVRFRFDAAPKPRFVVDDALGFAFKKILKAVGISRPRCGFYWLRHQTETIGGEAKDQAALDLVMGHADDSMAGEYREDISEARLLDVSNCIRDWLYGEKEEKESEQ